MPSDLQKYRKKLDKNNDGLVTLDEYLATELSKGPREKSGRINYHYQSFENVYHYFLITLKKIKKFKILCVPNFTVRYGNYTDKTALVYNLKNDEVIYGGNMLEGIGKCSNSKKIRFIFFSLILELPDKYGNHANMVLIDVKKKTLERFEPHGANFNIMPNSKKYMKKIDDKFKKYIIKDLGLKKYKYLSPSKLSPKLGIQLKADAFCGMCVTISMMYLHMRVLNPDLKQLKLVKFIMNRPKPKLKEMILKYAKHVEETLKENEIYVLDLIQEVIDELYHL